MAQTEPSTHGRDETAIFAIDLEGHQRLIWRAPGVYLFDDVSSDGRALLVQKTVLTVTRALAPGATAERDLSWFDGAMLADLSADGRTVLFNERGVGGGADGRGYMRHTDGSDAAWLGPGLLWSLSPDGQSALAGVSGDPLRDSTSSRLAPAPPSLCPPVRWSHAGRRPGFPTASMLSTTAGRPIRPAACTSRS